MKWRCFLCQKKITITTTEITTIIEIIITKIITEITTTKIITIDSCFIKKSLYRIVSLLSFYKVFF